MNRIRTIKITKHFSDYLIPEVTFLYYIGYGKVFENPTPSSLARVMRAIQGNPVFGECCEWKWNGNSWDSICNILEDSIFIDYKYCPDCGRKIKYIPAGE